MSKERYLIEALSRGDTKAFDALFLEYYPKLKKFLSGFVDTGAEAEDLAQDVFIRLWQYRSLLGGVSNLNAYLYRMAKNCLYTYLERLYVSVLPDGAMAETPANDSFEELLFARELGERIDLAIEKMPLQRKKIFLLSRRDGLRNEEIAGLLGIGKRTVEAHISAALAYLRKIIGIIFLFF